MGSFLFSFHDDFEAGILFHRTQMRNLGFREGKCLVQCPAVSEWGTSELAQGLAVFSSHPPNVGILE